MNEKQKLMLLDWMRKIHQMEYAHRYESLKWNNWHSYLGVPSFLIATGIALTYKLPKVDEKTFESLPFLIRQEFFVAFSAITVAILTGLQTFLKPNERAEKHKSSSTNYEKLRHKIETLINSSDLSDIESKIADVKSDWDSIDALNVSPTNFAKGKERVSSFKRYPEELSFIDRKES